MEEYLGLIDDKVKHVCLLARRVNSLGATTAENKNTHITLRRQMMSDINNIKDVIKLCDKEADKLLDGLTHHLDVLDNMKLN